MSPREARMVARLAARVEAVAREVDDLRFADGVGGEEIAALTGALLSLQAAASVLVRVPRAARDQRLVRRVTLSGEEVAVDPLTGEIA